MTTKLKDSQPATKRLRSVIRAAAFLAFTSLLLPVGVLAQNKGPCSNASLKGEYAAHISGVRSFGGITENFVGISLRKYDGNGNFTEEFASFHGAITGNQTATAAPGTTSGTYQVNSNCTGTSTLNPPPIPNSPPPIVSDFVIMDNAKEVREIVTSPLTNVVSAVLKRN